MIELQPFGRDDFARLISWAVTPAFVLQWAGGGFTYPLDEQQLEEYLKPTETTPTTRRIFKVGCEKYPCMDRCILRSIPPRKQSTCILLPG